MRTGTEQEKLKSIAVHTVNEQPVGPDVALPDADIISGESVVTVPVRQSLPGGEPVHNGVQLIQRQAAPGCKLEVFLESVGKDDFQHPSARHSWRP